jgi:hypothetical protein
MGHRTIAASVVGAAGILTVGMMTVAEAGHTNNVLTAQLDGRQEVSETGRGVSGDPNGTGEAYVFGIDGDPNTLCYVLTVDKVAETELAPSPTAPRAAHIHKGAAGTNGPVAVNLAWPQDGQSADCLTLGEEGKFTGQATVQEILNNPEGFYVNVHNSEYPGGAIRAQLAEQHSH